MSDNKQEKNMINKTVGKAINSPVAGGKFVGKAQDLIAGKMMSSLPNQQNNTKAPDSLKKALSKRNDPLQRMNQSRQTTETSTANTETNSTGVAGASAAGATGLGTAGTASSMSKPKTGGSKNKGKKSIKNIKKKAKLIAILAGLGFGLILIVLIASVAISGLLAIREFVQEGVEKAKNFVTGCGWRNNYECELKSEKDFYKKVDNIYDEYLVQRGVKLNKDLLIATLTYNNPFMVDTTETKNINFHDNDGTEVDDMYGKGEGDKYDYDEHVIITDGSGRLNYKKASSQVDYLATRMVDKTLTFKVVKIHHEEVELEDGTTVDVVVEDGDIFDINWIWGDADARTQGDVKKKLTSASNSETKKENSILKFFKIVVETFLSFLFEFLVKPIVMMITNTEIIDITGENYRVVIGYEYNLNTDKYRDFLQGTDETGYNKYNRSFLTQFYLSEPGEKPIKYCDASSQEIINKCNMAQSVTDNIFSRAKLMETLDNNGGNYVPPIAQNVKVKIYKDRVATEEINLKDYLMGVVYANMNEYSSDAYLKYLAISAKNYLYASNLASPNSLALNLSTENSALRQTYCSISLGCHYLPDGTLASANATDGSYYKEPLESDDPTYIRIRDAVEATLSEFLIANDSIVRTHIDSSNSSMIEELLKNQTYAEVLSGEYGGSVEVLDLNTQAYPLDPKYNYITSAFGWRINPLNRTQCRTHGGVDISASCQAKIYAIASGVVVLNQWHNSFGNYTIIGHGNKDAKGNYEYYSLYAHQYVLSPYVTVGSTVAAGQQIGIVGSTGDSTGCHLHIEVRKGTSSYTGRVDPMPYLESLAELNNPYGGSAEYPSESACKAALGNKNYAVSNNYNLLTYDYANYLKELR